MKDFTITKPAIPADKVEEPVVMKSSRPGSKLLQGLPYVWVGAVVVLGLSQVILGLLAIGLPIAGLLGIFN
ncbi:MAG: hypothetical protein M1379_16610 [Firmicutes bacterium]|nr:hypothetical protein [Bacillota bacterium]